MVLEAKNISFQYGRDTKQILENFSLRMESHERVGIVAPSGFGKTTFCKILSGYEKPDGGEVLLDGKPLSSYGRYCPVQMIWQHPEQVVNPRLRMREVLKQGDEIEEYIVEGLGIEEDWKNRFPAEISGGEMQRFCIARALGRRTRFLLADAGFDYPEPDLEFSDRGSGAEGNRTSGREPQYAAVGERLYEDY